ncbi:MAG: peptidoglycan-binding protein LysM, partial [Mangrovicoccus sp.]|nr:peptidoglycan-binding protein LysM [Mangrovicoccus sp.]
MGLFSFLKGAGKKLTGAAQADEAPDESALKKELEDLGLDAGVEVKVEGDKVKITGTPKDQAAKEKAIIAIGNVAGVATVEDETPGEAPVIHVVEKGDTLSAIAKKTLGNANRYMEIFEANKPMLSDPDKIYPGQSLRIPKA